MKPVVKQSVASKSSGLRPASLHSGRMDNHTDGVITTVLGRIHGTLADRVFGFSVPRQVRTMRIIHVDDSVRQELDQFESSCPFEADWDGQGALAIDHALVISMSELVSAYARRLPTHRRATLELEVNPVVDGTIDVAWYTPKARLLMNFRWKDGEPCMLYYGALNGESDSIKGRICSDQPAEFLVTWMNTVLF